MFFTIIGKTVQHDGKDFVIKPGYSLTGKVSVMGYWASVVIELAIPDRFYLKGEMSPMKFAGDRICLTRTGDPTKGPLLEIELQPKENQVIIFSAMTD